MNKVNVKVNDLILLAPQMNPDNLCEVCVVRTVDENKIGICMLSTSGDYMINRNTRHFRVIGHVNSLDLYYKNYDDPNALNG